MVETFTLIFVESFYSLCEVNIYALLVPVCLSHNSDKYLNVSSSKKTFSLVEPEY